MPSISAERTLLAYQNSASLCSKLAGAKPGGVSRRAIALQQRNRASAIHRYKNGLSWHSHDMGPPHYARRTASALVLALGMQTMPANAEHEGDPKTQNSALSVQPSPELRPSVLKALGELPREGGVAALQAALEGGLTPTSAVIALEALGEQGGHSAVLTLEGFATHRMPAVRLAALRALGKAAGAQAHGWLSRGLGDSTDAVRDGCAETLLARGTSNIAPRLALAMDQGSLPAAAAFGRWADPPELVQALKSRLQRLPLPLTLAGYASALQRSDVDMSIKAELLAQLQEQGTPAVRRHLTLLLQTHAVQGHARLHRAIQRAINRIPTVLPKGKQE